MLESEIASTPMSGRAIYNLSQGGVVFEYSFRENYGGKPRIFTTSERTWHVAKNRLLVRANKLRVFEISENFPSYIIRTKKYVV